MMILYDKFATSLPVAEKVVVVLSGGMDSTIALNLCQRRYGPNAVHAITYFYNQKQSREIECAKVIANRLGIQNHSIIDISFLGLISKPISANIVGGLPMPTITDILGDPTPPTYVPNRNAILLMIAAAYAESNGASVVVTGLQSQDQYGYHDTTPSFIRSVNDLLDHARVRKVQVVAPFIESNKETEILLLQEMNGNVDLLSNTLTCYNPNEEGLACGRCPSCSERIANFIKAGLIDPARYSINIDWSML